MVVKKKVDGFNWYLDVSDGGIGRTLYHSNTTGEGFSFSRECAFMHILNETIKPGMTCIDLGANIGYATMMMLKNVGSSGYVYAIEPDSHNLKLLTININENGFLASNLCEITRCLITNKNGESPFWIARHPNLNSVRKQNTVFVKKVFLVLNWELFVLAGNIQILLKWISKDMRFLYSRVDMNILRKMTVKHIFC